MNENKSLKEEMKSKLEVKEDGEMEEIIEMGIEFYKKAKKDLFARAFITGVLSAVSVYSIIVILVLIG